MTPPVPSSKRRLSQSSLNKLQAKVLRAKLLGLPGADKLEKEYEEESRKAAAGGYVAEGEQKDTRIEVLPTLDARGRLYDVGTGKEDDQEVLPGNRKKKDQKVCNLFIFHAIVHLRQI